MAESTNAASRIKARYPLNTGTVIEYNLIFK